MGGDIFKLRESPDSLNYQGVFEKIFWFWGKLRSMVIILRIG
jgi:hypothetical protein